LTVAALARFSAAASACVGAAPALRCGLRRARSFERLGGDRAQADATMQARTMRLGSIVARSQEML